MRGNRVPFYGIRSFHFTIFYNVSVRTLNSCKTDKASNVLLVEFSQQVANVKAKTVHRDHVLLVAGQFSEKVTFYSASGIYEQIGGVVIKNEQEES